MLKLTYRCPACGLTTAEVDESTHACLTDGETRYSVHYVSPSADDEAGNDWRLVMWSVSVYAVTINLRRKPDPENYQVTEWTGHDGAGTADEGERVWGDAWLEAH